MTEVWPEGFVCEGCLKLKDAKRKDNKYTAKRKSPFLISGRLSSVMVPPWMICYMLYLTGGLVQKACALTVQGYRRQSLAHISKIVSTRCSNVKTPAPERWQSASSRATRRQPKLSRAWSPDLGKSSEFLMIPTVLQNSINFNLFVINSYLHLQVWIYMWGSRIQPKYKSFACRRRQLKGSK